MLLETELTAQWSMGEDLSTVARQPHQLLRAGPCSGQRGQPPDRGHCVPTGAKETTHL